ncbi:hypothetical protein SH668x_001685 [Planctomicrobium sp. SH668]|uniref:hypothetical protein n=1 Tax=Planctomicrobium sp. SH668 TaxID=3448126 RepID=UPI003F5C3F70
MRNGLQFRDSNYLRALTLLSLTLSIFLTRVVVACPFCDAPTTTLGEQHSTAQATLLAKWISVSIPDPNTFSEGSTTYEVLLSAGKEKEKYPAGTRFTIPLYLSGTEEDESLFFVTKTENDQVNWGLPVLTNREVWKYINSAPDRKTPNQVRLLYYVEALEHADPDIAMDAYAEFAGISYADLQSIADHLPREKLVSWLSNPEATPTRFGLYGLMLGLCGNSDDAAFLETIIRQQPEDSRMGIDGMMAGYMLLTENEGLKNLTQWKLDDPAASDNEVYSFLKALEFMWSYGQDHADPQVLKETLRKMIDRPGLTGLVVLDLSRWQDWEIMDHLVSQYGKNHFEDRHPRQCVLRYLIAATKDAPEPNESIDYRLKAQNHLNQLREIDPENVKYVERHPFD